MQIMTHSLEEFNAEARRFAEDLLPRQEGATVVALSGDLGAGKTTFTQEIARFFGVDDQVTSPTFVIEKIYASGSGMFERLVHIDAYRLRGAHELEVLGWKELVTNSANLILIEWPENVRDAIPEDAAKVSLSGTDEERTIVYG